MKKTVWILIIITSITFAQEVKKLSLAESIKLALENNHDYKKAKYDKEKALEQVREAYGNSVFPQINGSINYNRAIKRAEFIIDAPGFSGKFPVGSKNTLTGSVSVTQPLFSGAMFLAIKVAKTFAKVSETNMDYSRKQLITNVKEAYYNRILAGSMLKLAKSQLNMAKKNLDDSESMYKAGLIPEYDYNKAKVNYQTLLPNISEYENQVKLTENLLKMTIGLDLEDKIVLTDSLSFNNLNLLDYEDGLNKVMNANDQIKQLQLQLKMQDYVVSYTFSQHLPSLDAVGNYQVQAQEEDTRHFNNWRYNNSVSVGLQLNIPIFKGFAQESRVEQEKIEYKKIKEDYLRLVKSIKTEFSNLYSTVLKNKEQVEAYKANLEQTKRGYELAEKRYKAGLGTQLELTSELVSYTEARVNYLRAIYDFQINLSKLDLLLGKDINEIEIN